MVDLVGHIEKFYCNIRQKKVKEKEEIKVGKAGILFKMFVLFLCLGVPVFSACPATFHQTFSTTPAEAP